MSSRFEIAIANREFSNASNALRQDLNAVVASDREVADIICRANTLIRYRETLREITGLMVLYVDLLEKDQGAVASVQANMVGRDNLIRNRFSTPNLRGGGGSIE